MRGYLPNAASFTVDIPVAFDGVLLAGGKNLYLDRERKIVCEETGDEVLTRPCGATIPVVVYFEKELDVPQVILSLGNSDCNMHAVAENISTRCVERGIRISRRFLGIA